MIRNSVYSSRFVTLFNLDEKQVHVERIYVGVCFVFVLICEEVTVPLRNEMRTNAGVGLLVDVHCFGVYILLRENGGIFDVPTFEADVHTVVVYGIRRFLAALHFNSLCAAILQEVCSVLELFQEDGVAL